MTESRGGNGNEDELGAADELRELVASLVELVARLAPAAGAEHGVGQPSRDPDSTLASCEWCPLCTLAALARGERTELARTAVDYAGVLLGLLRAVLDETLQRGPHASHGAEASGGQGTGPPREREAPPKVQRIPVRRSSVAG
jgi:hypothetical protein